MESNAKFKLNRTVDHKSSDAKQCETYNAWIKFKKSKIEYI